MYDSNEYGTQSVVYGGRSNRRTWLAAGASLAAVLVLLILIMAACQARADRADQPASGIGFGGASPSASATADPDAPGESTGGQSGGSGGDGGGGGGDQGPGPGPEGSEEETEDAEEPAPPLDIEATIDTVAPGGQCFAAGTIAVSGGDYPVTVHYQWRRLVVAGGWDGEPVSAVQNHTFDEPGAIQVQTNNLPENGTNVFLVVTGPKSTGSGLYEYGGCADGPDGFTDGD
jgi:hypothetical protein